MTESVGKIRKGRQRRPRVPEAERKRTAQACLPCRQHKEKCDGGNPCTRCQKRQRTCGFESPSHRQVSMIRHDSSEGGKAEQHAKELQMKRIITHFLGDVSFETSDLQKVADDLEHNSKQEQPLNDSIDSNDASLGDHYSVNLLSTSMMHYSGELSHWNFSRMLERRLRTLDNQARQDGSPEHEKGFFRATALHASGSSVALAKSYFPPKHIAEFLTNAFLKFSQTNYFYFDEATFREKLDFYYSTTTPPSINDVGWICTLLMTFAIGTQFAHMQSSPSPGGIASATEASSDDQIGLELYRFSCRLIPDLITVASVETVQAFLLIGVYTLPIDTSGLAYIYYGLAIKMAIQNGMHRKLPEGKLAPEIAEMRDRLWWSAYSLERRIGILHGRPLSVSPAEIDAPMPIDLPALRPTDRLTNLPNFTAAIVLTDHLAKASEVMRSLRRCSKVRKEQYLRQLAVTRDQLNSWWNGLATAIYCRDLTVTGPFFRCNVHLEIYYQTTLIYMGRPFIISQLSSGLLESTDNATVPEVPDIVNVLRHDSLQAALRVIELCQLLQDTVGLARVSYTEFNGCRVALLALIAHSINGPTSSISKILNQGMALIRQICTGESAQSEVAVIEALERARQRLHNHLVAEQRGPTETATGYDQFREWTKLWRGDLLDGGDVNVINGPNMPFDQRSSNSNMVPPSFDGFFSSFPDELSEFAAIPGLNYDFSLASGWLSGSQPEGSAWPMDPLL